MTRQLKRLLIIVFAVTGAYSESRADGDDQDQFIEDAKYDCGTKSLYDLMYLEGRPISLDRIAKELDRIAPGERSLAAIRDVAKSFGLGLRGIRIGPTDRSIDRPALVFLDRKPHGHFAIVRPAGHTGSLVQVIDPGHDPIVIDFADYRQSAEWTGIALIPIRERTSWLPFLILSTMLGLAVTASLTRRRRATKGKTNDNLSIKD